MVVSLLSSNFFYLRTKFSPNKSYGFGWYPHPSFFTDIPPKNVLQKVLKMVFFAQKTPVFGPKNRLRIWGYPSPPFTDKNFGKKGGYGFGGYPSPPFTDKIRKVVFDLLPYTPQSYPSKCPFQIHTHRTSQPAVDRVTQLIVYIQIQKTWHVGWGTWLGNLLLNLINVTNQTIAAAVAFFSFFLNRSKETSTKFR